MNRSFASRVAVCVLALGMPLAVSPAANAALQWGANGNGGNGIWDTTTLNWFDGTNAVAWPGSSYPYTTAETAIFNGPGGTVNIHGSIAASHLIFNSPGYTIGVYTLFAPSSGLTITTNADAALYAQTDGSSGGTFTKDGSSALTATSSSILHYGALNILGGDLIASPDTMSNGTFVSIADAPGVFLTLAGTGNSGNFRIGGLNGGGANGGSVRAKYPGGTTLGISGVGGSFAGQLQNGGGTLGLTIYSGTQTLTGSSSYSGDTIIYDTGKLALGGGGSIANSSITLNRGNLSLDNSASVQNDRISDSAALTMAGGSLILQGNANSAVLETAGVLQPASDIGTVNVIATGDQSSGVKFASFGSGAGSILFQGDHLGEMPGAGVANITFTTAPTLLGGGGVAGSTNISLLSHALGGSGTTFVTYGTNGVRPLTDAEFAGSLIAANTANVSLTADATLPAATSINSLRILDSLTINGGGNLKIGSGMVIAAVGSTTFNQSGLDFGSADGLIYGSGDLTINSVIAGNATNGLNKYGDGKLTLTANNTYTGDTHITGGILNVQNDHALGSIDGAVVSVTYARVELQGPVNGGLNFVKTLQMGNGSITNVSGTNKWSGSGVLSLVNSTIDVSGGSLTLAGQLLLSIVKVGAGDLTLNGSIYGNSVQIAAEGHLIWTAPSGSTALSGFAIGDGALKVAPTGSGTTATLNVNPTGNTPLTYFGNSRLEVDRGAYSNLVLSFGNIYAPIGSSGSTLIIAPSDGLSALGGSEKVMGTYSNTLDGSLIGQDNDASASGDFLQYDTSNGYLPATYSTLTNLNNSSSSTIFNASTPQTLSSNRSVGQLKNSGQTISLGNSTLTIGSLGLTSGLIMNGGAIASGTLAFRNGSDIYTSLAGGTISSKLSISSGGSGNLILFGPGKLTYTGTSTSPISLTLNSGTLQLDGALAGPINIHSGAVVMGSGSITSTLNGGLISPGFQAGIITANGVGTQATFNTYSTSSNAFNTFKTVSNTRFAFEFQQTGHPNYGSATASGNDLLRLTNPETPFLNSLTSNNEINVYFNLASGIPQMGDFFDGGFFTDRQFDFLASIQNAIFSYYIADVTGGFTLNGQNYRSYTTLPIVVKTVMETANFSSGTANGYVTSFEVVPEPSSLILFLLSASLLAIHAPKATSLRTTSKAKSSTPRRAKSTPCS